MSQFSKQAHLEERARLKTTEAWAENFAEKSLDL